MKTRNAAALLTLCVLAVGFEAHAAIPLNEAGYFSGMFARVGRVLSGAMEWAVLIFLLLYFSNKGKRKQKVPLIKPVLSALMGILVSGLLYVFIPILPEWVMVIVAIIASFYIGHSNRVWGGLFQARTVPIKTVDVVLPAVTAQRPRHDTHGSAYWADDATANAHGHFKNEGCKLGKMPESGKLFDYLGHVITCASTGSGKGVSAVIPHLLTYRGNCVVLDIKGENYAVTGRARRDLGQQVYAIDPFQVSGEPSNSFNVFDYLDATNPDIVGLSASLANALVLTEKDANDHWTESAKQVIQGLICHIATYEDDSKRNLVELGRLLSLGLDDFYNLVADLKTNPHAFGLPKKVGNLLETTPEKERGSILSTARRNTAFLDDPRIQDVVSRSDVPLDAIKTAPMSVYIIIPPSRLDANTRFIRMFITTLITTITATPAKPANGNVSFVLDEFAKLGHMKEIEDAMGLVRGYGLSLWVFIQDISQLKGVYKKWQTFMANATKQFFGTGDHDTAKYISDLLGMTTIEYETVNESENEGTSSQRFGLGGFGTNAGSGFGTSQQLAGRSLLTPDEVMRLSKRPIVIIRGEPPYLLQPLNYLQDSMYQGLYDPNPYHQ